jgi:HSP20 family protein
MQSPFSIVCTRSPHKTFLERRLTRIAPTIILVVLDAIDRRDQRTHKTGGRMALVRFTRRQPRVGFPTFPGSTAFPALPAFEDMDSRMNRFIERAFGDAFASGATPEALGWVPAMEISESAKELTLTAELPGIDEKDIDVSVDEGMLTIRGEKTEEKKEGEEDKKVYLYERTYGSFSRSFALPANVDAANIVAKFEKGILKIHLPKLADVKPKARKVEIKSA